MTKQKQAYGMAVEVTHLPSGKSFNGYMFDESIPQTNKIDYEKAFDDVFVANLSDFSSMQLHRKATFPNQEKFEMRSIVIPENILKDSVFELNGVVDVTEMMDVVRAKFGLKPINEIK